MSISYPVSKPAGRLQVDYGNSKEFFDRDTIYADGMYHTAFKKTMLSG